MPYITVEIDGYGEFEVDADQDESDIEEEIASHVPEDVEMPPWRVISMDDFGELDFDDLSDLDLISRLAKMISEHGDAVIAWYIGIEDIDFIEKWFDDAYYGEWDESEDFAMDFLESIYNIPPEVSIYIDWNHAAEDLERMGFSYYDYNGKLYVFREC